MKPLAFQGNLAVIDKPLAPHFVADAVRLPLSRVISIYYPTSSSIIMADSAAMQEGQPRKKFAPKEPVQLQAPKDDPISTADLSKCDGESLSHASPRLPARTCIFQLLM